MARTPSPWATKPTAKRWAARPKPPTSGGHVGTSSRTQAGMAEDLCQGMLGMLLPRPCDRKASVLCEACQKRYCADHLDASNPKICRACGTKSQWPKASDQGPVAQLGFTAADLAAFELPAARSPEAPWVDLT